MGTQTDENDGLCSPGTQETRKPGNQGNRANSLTRPVYRSTGFPVYQIYFHSNPHTHFATINKRTTPNICLIWRGFM